MSEPRALCTRTGMPVSADCHRCFVKTARGWALACIRRAANDDRERAA